MINILFSGNQGVFDGMLTCLLSVVKRTDTKEPFHVFIYTKDVSYLNPKYVPVSSGAVEILDGVLKKYNPLNQVDRIDVTEIYKKEFGGCPNEQCYCSPYTLLRLFADMVEGMPDKLLYLDADILFNRDICLLYDTDIEDYEYAAARDHYGKYLLNPNYINAGVLLFNMKKMRQTGLLKKARTLIKTRKLLFADQSAIYRSTTAKKMLPQKYNDQKFLHKWTVVRHFSKRLFYTPYPHIANIKQWNVSQIHKIFGYYCFDDVLYEYIYLKRLFEDKGARE
jgi:lipopolysaccharide biosynthesis glycosyltransferase